MLTTIQIKAEGFRAQDVDAELRATARSIGRALGNKIRYSDQVIEGRPGDPSPSAFRGRLTITIVAEGEPVKGTGVKVVGTNG